jgi:hypothetical protein
MSRHTLAAALLLGLAAGPALAQTTPAESPLAPRTLEQNQRAYLAPPARPQVTQDQPVRDRPVAVAPSATAGRRLALADTPRR